MNRRHFLTGATTAGAVVAASMLPKPAIAAKKHQWTAVSAFGKAGLLGTNLDSFCTFVTQASGGRLSITPYHAGELVSAFESFDAVQGGQAQMGYGAPYYWQGKSDAISFVAAMPFGFTAQEQNAWFYYGGGIEMADKIYNGLGVKFLPIGNTGNQMGGWYRFEIESLDQLKGLKFRMPGLGGEILKTFGVTVVLTPGGEVLPSLTSGALDGTEWVGPAADMGFGLYKVAKYYYYPGWHEPATCLDSFFNLDAWNELEDDLKDLVTKAAQAHNLALLSEFQARNNAALDKLINEHGVQLRFYGDDILTAIGKRAGEVLPELAAKSPLATEIFQHIAKFRKTMVQWSGYSDGAFIQARNLPINFPE